MIVNRNSELRIQSNGRFRPSGFLPRCTSSQSFWPVPESHKLAEAIKKALIFEFERASDNSLLVRSGIKHCPVNVAFTVYVKQEGGSGKWEVFSSINCAKYCDFVYPSYKDRLFNDLPAGKYRFKFKLIPSRHESVSSKPPLDGYYGGTVETDWIAVTVPPVKPSNPSAKDEKAVQLKLWVTPLGFELVAFEPEKNDEWENG